MIVDINKIEECLRYFKSINETPIEDIIWVKGDETIYADKEALEEFQFIGLSNKDFPSVMDWLPDDVGIKISSLLLNYEAIKNENIY